MSIIKKSFRITSHCICSFCGNSLGASLAKGSRNKFFGEGKCLKGRIHVAINTCVSAGIKCSYKQCVLLDSRIYDTTPVWDIQYKAH